MKSSKSEAFTFVKLLKVCAEKKDLLKGSKIHSDVLKRGLLQKSFSKGVASMLISMYAECGVIAKSQEVLDELLVRDVVTWSSLISAYAKQGQWREAMNCFDRMKGEAILSDALTLASILKVSSSMKALHKGKQIHNEIISIGTLNENIVLATGLVNMYAKCGMVAEAQKVFDDLSLRDVISWSALISGYTQHGKAIEALNCYEQMQKDDISPDAMIFTCVLKACGSTGAVEKGEEVHKEVSQRGLLNKDIFLTTAVVDMYAKCGILTKALEVFDGIPVRDVVSWNAIISACVQQGKGHEALNFFGQMHIEGLNPNVVTFTCILNACGITKAVEKGQEIHQEIVAMGLLKQNVVLGNSLVDMYIKFGMLTEAHQVLNDLPVRDVVSWNTLVAGYAEQGKGHEALQCFQHMQNEEISPDAITFVSALNACGHAKAIQKGKQIHGEIVRMSLLDENIALNTALVEMYAKCGMLTKARQVFNEFPVQDSISWSVLISGYAQRGLDHEALSCYQQMRGKGICPDAVTLVCILKVCSRTGAVDKGKEIYDEVTSRGLLENDIVICNALVDMYAKCGMLAKAKQILEELPIQNVTTWNALITGYARQGKSLEALNCFNSMNEEGISPDAVTMLGILNACNHSGLVNEAQMCLGDMHSKYGIKPSTEHHICMMDAFGCAGHFDQAMLQIRNMTNYDYPPVWLALLSACKKWGNVSLGRIAFDKAMQLDKENAVYYVLMASLYRTAGMQEDAEIIEALKVQNVSEDGVGQCVCRYV